MQSVIISVGAEVEVEAPYNPRFHDAADELGGTLTPDSDVWRFARSDEDHVRRLCSEIFGHDTSATSRRVQPREVPELPEAETVSAHQRRANLLDRLNSLLDEVADVHTALQGLNKQT
ncbi:hypothetical protein [Nocardia carnea]|uniref:hypothetical protein n=1 Tax=Nocardia carnea TaxID=37328 RepID=UPI00245565EE|nr:hypothetical protein [Nocardia carnea]